MLGKKNLNEVLMRVEKGWSFAAYMHGDYERGIRNEDGVSTEILNFSREKKAFSLITIEVKWT